MSDTKDNKSQVEKREEESMDHMDDSEDHGRGRSMITPSVSSFYFSFSDVMILARLIFGVFKYP